MANILPDLIRIRFTYLLLLLGLSSFAQEVPDSTRAIVPSKELQADSILIANKVVPETTSSADSVTSTVLEAPITYNATDSIVISLDGKKVYLYKEAVVNYQAIELKADYIELDLQTKEVYAEGVPDSADVMQGEPVFKDGQEEFESETLRYNFETQKGIITEVKTQQGEGYVHSERTKKIDANAFILKKGKYTTCDADHPHFYLRMTKAKVISNKKIITGPAYLVLEDFPIYFPMIPFGFFPNSPTYSSGIIIPTYGEEQNRGFFLREGGYYWAASQYFDLTVKGDIYSKGSWGSNLHTNYKKRYKFSGSFDFRYNVNRYSDPGLPDFSRSPGFSLQWSHSQDSKANPFQTFSANVNLSTTSYDKQNSYNVQSYLQTTKSSSISYSKKWENSPFNMSSSFRHSQNSRDSTISLSFPELTFSMSKIYPFKQKGRVGAAKWYEKIGFSYTGNIKNSITAREDELLNKSLVTDWSNGWKHSIPISLPNFNLLKHINVSPSISYSERWYTNYLEKNYAYDHVAEEGTLWVDTIYHFKRNYNYSFSLSSQTNIYGMYLMKNPNSRVKAIRHKISPSVSLSYNPDFTDPKYGFWDSYIDENGDVITYNRFSNGIFGSASSRESGSINFGLTNNLEAKVAAKNDTTATENKFEKVKIIDNLGFSGSYNLIADSLNLSNIRINGRTTIKGVNLNFGGTLDPYSTDLEGKKINKFMWNEASGLAKLGRLTNANLSFGMSFKSKKEDQEKDGGESNVEEVVYPDGRVEYYDFSMPWDFRFDYSLSYSKRSPYHDAQINQSLNFSGRLNLTREWNMQLTTNFDVQAGEFSFTTFNVNRKLHCWNMSFNFVPFGQRKSYSFTINASSSMLKDLKVNKQRSWFDNN
ncbi:putative LPS assembly protein LptD [Sunxiuqinia sp. sy24]|uniref:putative LPS assembly protein LptD n=1 Tax=Sunxiuqinia sp. sy24 TaxID=3461495 RepID=UPI0040452AF3